MFDGITDQSLLSMTAQQRRWLDNVKKAFHESDLAYSEGRPETREPVAKPRIFTSLASKLHTS